MPPLGVGPFWLSRASTRNFVEVFTSRVGRDITIGMRVTEHRLRGGMSGGIGFRLTAEQRDALEHLAAERGQRISDVAREAIATYLEATTKDDQWQPRTS